MILHGHKRSRLIDDRGRHTTIEKKGRVKKLQKISSKDSSSSASGSESDDESESESDRSSKLFGDLG